MKAPLPEVPPHVPDKVPPSALSVLCAMELFFFATELWFFALYVRSHEIEPETVPLWGWMLLGFVGVLFVLSPLLIYFLWRGYALARRIWLWLTVVSLGLYFFPDESIEESRAEEILDYFSSALGLCMFVYLNLPNVKAHFAQRKPVESN